MSFLDKVTKAVSETVDRGKKEVDQFMRIQKVKGDITREEEGIRAAGARVQQVKQEIGDLVIARLKAGTLADGALQQMADRVSAVEAEIAGHQAVITEKRAEIARIEAEGSIPAPLAPPGSPVPVPPAPQAAGPGVTLPPPLPGAPATQAPPPPLPVTVTTTCPQCGATLSAKTAFCTECGAKLA